MEQKKSDRRRMTVILGAGFLLRLCYVLFSTIYERQYDIGMIDLDAGHTVTGGHLAYIQYLYETGGCRILTRPRCISSIIRRSTIISARCG